MAQEVVSASAGGARQSVGRQTRGWWWDCASSSVDCEVCPFYVFVIDISTVADPDMLESLRGTGWSGREALHARYQVWEAGYAGAQNAAVANAPRVDILFSGRSHARMVQISSALTRAKMHAAPTHGKRRRACPARQHRSNGTVERCRRDASGWV
ncbi:hypothetical protein CALVIDRAFT_284629 [Calocera viscosa TUFC12733]|uniref:Uncharacterized protein n=1 Tax=Calocera viscosa (strain TUFC12733) TaxID=1330018 RepID=A0A167IU51_CALVF|nr:hypothetical protein CALVIDRAFT_284629 [Calocera viscosa TUFC12733]